MQQQDVIATLVTLDGDYATATNRLVIRPNRVDDRPQFFDVILCITPTTYEQHQEVLFIPVAVLVPIEEGESVRIAAFCAYKAAQAWLENSSKDYPLNNN